MNPDNRVVKLCADGMRAEGEGRMDEARVLFEQAWVAREDDFDACIAAHYVARHQVNARDTLRWNREALDRAEAVGDERVRDLYPSLYLNLAHAHEQLGEWHDAQRYYDLATESLRDLRDDGYGNLVRTGIANGQARLQAVGTQLR